ncbi:hypothetical protein [Haloarchaeobius amylolyticus]|uniref:hypothetical protein n=1 Tax=Haloarchaeobius amylolyticus TaxID=1198296 RepID=UPI00226D6D57|nr:hypothetical protein [Haloarchaeobius amylolyticus]
MVVLALGLIVSLVATPAAAAVDLTVETSYQGVEGDSQAVSTTVTITPDGPTMKDIRIEIDETSSSFVDFNSFTRTTEPGTADINITYQGDGVYVVEELERGETITITFEAYPRTIKAESLDVATIQIDYVQNGQDLDARSRASVSLENSSYFALQSEQSEVESLSEQVDDQKQTISGLESDVEAKEETISNLESENAQLKTENQQLQSQVDSGNLWGLIGKALSALLVLGLAGSVVYWYLINTGDLEGPEESSGGSDDDFLED